MNLIAPLFVWDPASVYLFLIFFALEITHQLAVRAKLNSNTLKFNY
jgi:hypothetical protein